jgi:tetratricopeptide (TPR) repeat protein
MRDLLKQMGRKDVAFIDRDLGFELCEKDSIDAIVLGSFVKAGTMFATDVKVLDVHSKQLLKGASARGEGVESILKSQIDQLSREISRGVGLSEHVAQSASVPIVEHTTASMDAYNYYLRGLEEYDRFYFADARRFFLRALATDTGFASAYARLGLANYQLGNTADAVEAFENARRHVQRATIKERMKIESLYASLVQHDSPRSISILQDIIRLYPKEKEAYYALGGLEQSRNNPELAIENLRKALELDPGYAEALNRLAYVYSDRGSYEEAIECLKKYASLQPGHANPFDSMGELYYRMGRLDDAIAKYKEALEVRPDFFPSRASLAYVYGLKGEGEAGKRCLQEMLALAQSGDWLAEIQCNRAISSYMTGELGRATRLLREAGSLADTAGNFALKAACEWIAGWIQFDRGDYKGCMQVFRRFLDYRMKSDTSVGAAAVAQYCYAAGRADIQQRRLDSARTRMALIRSLPKPGGIQAQSAVDGMRDRLLAEILIAEDSVEQAIAVLRNMKPWPIPTFATAPYVYYNFPFERDFLVRAYMKRGSLDEAIAECERIATFDPSSSERRLIHPRYIYLLATLYERKGLTAKAEAEYRRLLGLWKAADRNLPEYVDTLKRLAKLVGRLP